MDCSYLWAERNSKGRQFLGKTDQGSEAQEGLLLGWVSFSRDHAASVEANLSSSAPTFLAPGDPQLQRLFSQ